MESTYAVSESEASSDENGEDGADESYDAGHRDTRSIRSFSSMMSRETPEDRRERLTLADRLANMPALSRLTVCTRRTDSVAVINVNYAGWPYPSRFSENFFATSRTARYQHAQC